MTAVAKAVDQALVILREIRQTLRPIVTMAYTLSDDPGFRCFPASEIAEDLHALALRELHRMIDVQDKIDMPDLPATEDFVYDAVLEVEANLVAIASMATLLDDCVRYYNFPMPDAKELHGAILTLTTRLRERYCGAVDGDGSDVAHAWERRIEEVLHG